MEKKIKKFILASTGAIVIATTGLTGVLFNKHHHNDSTKYVCPLTSLITDFCDYGAYYGVRNEFDSEILSYREEGNNYYRLTPGGKVVEEGNNYYRLTPGGKVVEEGNNYYHLTPGGKVVEEGNNYYRLIPVGKVIEGGNDFYHMTPEEYSLLLKLDFQETNMTPIQIDLYNNDVFYQWIISDDQLIYDCQWSYVDGEFVKDSMNSEFVPRLKRK